MLVANISYQLMQIIIYLPSSSWLQVLALVKANCGNGFKCALQETQIIGVARHFDWGNTDQKYGRLSLLMNLKKYSQTDVILL